MLLTAGGREENVARAVGLAQNLIQTVRDSYEEANKLRQQQLLLQLQLQQQQQQQQQLQMVQVLMFTSVCIGTFHHLSLRLLLHPY